MLRASATVLLAVGLLATAGCGGSSSDTSGSTSDTSSSSADSPSSTPDSPSSSPDSSSSSPDSSINTTRIVVAVKDGKVEPSLRRVKVDSGSRVRLQVTSDHKDEIHVHGYDLMKDLEAGTPGVLTFKADQTGVFEVELEDEGLQLVQLQVQ